MVVEQMLINVLKRARALAMAGQQLECPRDLAWFLFRKEEENTGIPEMLHNFARLDDGDLTTALKYWADSEDFVLSFVSQGLLNRKLFRVEWHNSPLPSDRIAEIRQKVNDALNLSYPATDLVFEGREQNRAYDPTKEQIKILFKNGRVLPIEQCSDVPLYTKEVTKYYVCYPKNIKIN